MRSLRLVAALPVVLATLWVSAGPARAATCSVANRTMTIEIPVDDFDATADIREPGGTITVDGVACAASVDIDTVEVLGDDFTQIVQLYLQGFPAARRIAWSLELGGDNTDRLNVNGTGTGSNLQAGTLADGSLAVDIDADLEADITGTGVDRVRFDGGDGPDRLSARLTLSDGVHVLAVRLQVEAGGGDDVITGGGGEDLLRGGRGHDVMRGGAGHDEIHGEGGNDDIEGNAGNDFLFGWSGDDYLSGGIGNDRLEPGTGIDFASGDAGNDGFAVPSIPDGDELDGGVGVDGVGYSYSNGVLIDLAAGYAQVGDGTVTFVSVENASGGTGNDTLIGDDGANSLSGVQGDDTLIGGGGLDFLDCGPGIDSWSDAADTTRFCENPL